MSVAQVCFTLFILGMVMVSESLRCAQSCLFIRMPIDRIIPTTSCKKLEKNNTQCSVQVEINHVDRIATGRLDIERCADISTQRVETIVTLKSTLISIIRYTCKEDDCNVNFVENLFTFASQIPPVNINSTKKDVTDLIYSLTSDASSIECTDTRSCEQNRLCQADYEITDIWDSTSIIFNSELTCISPLQDDYLINVRQMYSPDQSQTNNIFFRCNRNNCIGNQTTVQTILESLQPYFITDLFNSSNHSETCVETTSSAVSFLVLSRELTMLFVIISVFTFMNDWYTIETF